jgi:hypothetical protein
MVYHPGLIVIVLNVTLIGKLKLLKLLLVLLYFCTEQDALYYKKLKATQSCLNRRFEGFRKYSFLLN